ncbi:uncharacterized protein LOC34624567, partial [Cyclospora cayetanensis]|uniref:Uncharacterized protein LOC34624567 n=1 Tax=Cyclospora cayetanensis TaxID=88456 RepID=A0A6P6RVR9_9EIME
MRFSEHFPAVAQGGWKPPVSASSLADNNGCRFGRGEIQQPSSSSGVTTGVAEDSPASTEVQTAAESESSKPLAALPVSSLVGALVPLPVRTGRLLHAPQPRIGVNGGSAAALAAAAASALPPLVRIVAVSALLTTPAFCCNQDASQEEESAAESAAVQAPLQKGGCGNWLPAAKQQQQQQQSVHQVHEVLTLASAGADSAADTAAGSTVASGAAILQPTTSAVLIDYWQGRSAAGSGDVGGGATPSSSLGASAELSTGSASGVPFVYAAAIHDCADIQCSGSHSKRHAALRRCVFLLYVPWQLSVLSAQKTSVTQALAAAAALAPSSSSASSSASSSLHASATCFGTSNKALDHSLLAPCFGSRRMLGEMRCVPLLPADAAAASAAPGKADWWA